MKSSTANTMSCFQKAGACSGEKCMAWIKVEKNGSIVYEGCGLLQGIEGKEENVDSPTDLGE